MLYDPKVDPRTDETKNMLYPVQDRYYPTKVFLGLPFKIGLCNRDLIGKPEPLDK